MDLPAADEDGIQALSVKGRSGRSAGVLHSETVVREATPQRYGAECAP